METRRKLASIQTVRSLEPIDGADRILKANVMGWSVVVKKGEFAVGDPCVFFEIDSVLPERPWAEFLRPRSFRVRTAKLRGVLSQGLALPIASVLPNGGEYELGDDVTEKVGVLKYEPPAPPEEGLGPFPGAVPKTDEMRLQSALEVLEELRGQPYYISVKVDGMSCTVVRESDGLVVCSRNYSIEEGEHKCWQVARKYELKNLPEGFAVQGEVCGPGIQKNRLNLDSAELRVFSVFDVRGGQYLAWDDALRFCGKHELPPVEEVERGDNFAYNLEQLLEMAKGKYKGTKNRREGIVVRPLTERRSEALGGSRLSFKVINNDFLLKDED